MAILGFLVTVLTNDDGVLFFFPFVIMILLIYPLQNWIFPNKSKGDAPPHDWWNFPNNPSGNPSEESGEGKIFYDEQYDKSDASIYSAYRKPKDKKPK